MIKVMIDFIKNLYYMSPTVNYCEQPTGNFIARPFYAVSNIAFIIIGLLILSKGRKTVTSRAFSYSIIIVGLFSFIYDSTYSYLFQLFDIAGMFIFITLLVFLNIKRLGINLNCMWRWITLILGLLIVYFFKGEIGNIIFGVFVLFVLVSEWFIKEKNLRRDWFIGIILFMSGFVIWIFDATKIFCDPNNILNGRGVFHLFEAIAAFYIYRYYSKSATLKLVC